jgi:hypothetical protein
MISLELPIEQNSLVELSGPDQKVVIAIYSIKYGNYYSSNHNGPAFPASSQVAKAIIGKRVGDYTEHIQTFYRPGFSQKYLIQNVHSLEHTISNIKVIKEHSHIEDDLSRGARKVTNELNSKIVRNGNYYSFDELYQMYLRSLNNSSRLINQPETSDSFARNRENFISDSKIPKVRAELCLYCHVIFEDIELHLSSCRSRENYKHPFQT